MGFLDKAKAAANELAAKADTALGSAGLGGPSSGGDSDKYFRDLGVLAYLEGTGRSADPEDRARVTAALGDLEARGAIRSFALQTAAAPPPPPAPGMAGGGGYPAPPPPPPPAPGGAAPQWQAPPTAPATPTTPPPPPPSWMTKDDGGNP